MRTAEILAVGSELLTPFRSDTNSLHLTKRLNDLGIDVRAKSVVRDDRGDIARALTLACSRADLVLITGGLGPTEDDVTREAVAGALGLELREDAGILEGLRQRFAARRLVMPEINRRQAQVPGDAIVLPNSRGTAPGLWIPQGDGVVVLLPGPPRELDAIFEAHVWPRLRERTAGASLRRRVIRISGRAESHVDEVAQPIYNTFHTWPVPIETTILAGASQIELHLSASGRDTAEIDRALEEGVRLLAGALGTAVVSTDGRSIEEVVGGLLLERGLTIATAESCTGGLLSGRFTEVPGSSAWVVGGVVAYDNAVKIAELGVPEVLIAQHGAVSEPVAIAMASGVVTRLGATIGVAITGVAGPGGGTPAKPVGTVVIAVWQSVDRQSVRTSLFMGDRHTIRLHATSAALDLVRLMLLGS